MVPNGVPIFDLLGRDRLRTETRQQLGIADEKLVIAIGRLVPQKRPLVFLEKAAEAIAVNPETRFLWVGDGVLAPEWDRRVAELGLQTKVQRLPWQSDVLPYLFAGDLFLHVAEFEGLPLAILEAMSAGLPCAIAKHLLREMPFLDSKSAIEVGDNPNWAEILNQPTRLREIGANGRKIAERQFSFEAMAESYETLYHETIVSAR
jgi:glycosyltransferase involved in cell wall biosynthesis